MFNKDFKHIDEICETDTLHEARFSTDGLPDTEMIRELEVKKVDPVPMGKTREQIREEALLDALYVPDGPQKYNQ
jgi:hypothetical protein